MKHFRIRGTQYTVKASCLKQAIIKLVEEKDFTYRAHWYTRSNRKAWAEVETGYGYKCIVEEVEPEAPRFVGGWVADTAEPTEEATPAEEPQMIANSFDEFVDKTSEAIREVLNNTEAGQQISKALLAGALKKNPNMTPEEWAQMKSQFMTFIFTMFVKENPQAMNELGTHVYNELRA